MADDLTTQILIEIRDGIRATNERLGATRTELSGRLDRVVQEQIRHATAIVELEKGQRQVVHALVTMNDSLRGLNERLDNVLLGPLGMTVRDTCNRVDPGTEPRYEGASGKAVPRL